MKIGVVADIHYGPDADTQLGRNAALLLDTFCEAMGTFRPDLIVDLGDRINPVSHSQDLERTTWVRRRLTRVDAPVYHVLGNTDVVNLAKPELLAALEKRGSYESLDEWTPHIVLLDSEDPPFERVGGEIGERQLAWLADILERDARPSLVFCHHPLDDQDLSGHRYFAPHPSHAGVVNRLRVRALLERGQRVLATFAGHMHWARANVINRVPHITLGSLVDCAYTDGRSAGAFAEVSIVERHVDIRIAGLQPQHWRFAP
jgi:3',5'-cyclic AMP phosphodiesterase CpdA